MLNGKGIRLYGGDLVVFERPSGLIVKVEKIGVKTWLVWTMRDHEKKRIGVRATKASALKLAERVK